MSTAPFRSPIYHQIALVGHVILGALVMVAFVVRDEIQAVAMLGFFIVSFAHHLREDSSPDLFDTLIVVVALANAAGWGFNLFTLWRPYYDFTVHLSTTAVLTLVVHNLLHRGGLRQEMAAQTLAYAAGIVLVGAGLGAIWEIWEFGMHLLLNKQMNQGVSDVIADLTADLIGAILAVALGLWRVRSTASDERQAD